MLLNNKLHYSIIYFRTANICAYVGLYQIHGTTNKPKFGLHFTSFYATTRTMAAALMLIPTVILVIVERSSAEDDSSFDAMSSTSMSSALPNRLRSPSVSPSISLELSPIFFQHAIDSVEPAGIALQASDCADASFPTWLAQSDIALLYSSMHA